MNRKGRVAADPDWPFASFSTYVEDWLAMRGTDYALLDQLGRLTGGVAVLRPQGTPANLPDLPYITKSSRDFLNSTTFIYYLIQY